MSTDNMAIWDRVSKTDPKHTKAFSRAGGFKGTSVRPHFLILQATEVFGPIGKGWGWEVLETRTEHNMVFALVQVWWRDSDDPAKPIYHVGAQWGGTAVVEDRKSGPFHDDESFKKSVTDGVTKGLSYLGFAADIHLGMFDGDKYRNEVTEEFAAKEAEQEKSKQLRMDEAFITGAIATIRAAKNIDELISLGKGHAKRLREIRERDEAGAKLAESYANAGKEMREKFSPPEPEAPAAQPQAAE